VDIVNKHDAKEPLFLYYAPHNLHAPLQVPQNILNEFEFIDYQSRKLYAAMAHNLDNSIGALITALKEKDLYSNTLIVFSSDNGGPVYNNGSAGANNYPLRGGKTSNWEGGVRVNAFASGGLIPARIRGSKIEGLTAIWDWYGTFCGLAGVDPVDQAAAAAGLPPVESVDLWPLISGLNKTSPRTEVFLGNEQSGTTVQGVILNTGYKLLFGQQTQSSWTGPVSPNSTIWDADNDKHDCSKGCLFDVFHDPTEHDEISAQHPDIVKDLLARIQDAQKHVFSPDRGTTDPRACEAALNIYDGYWGPFIDV